MHTIRLKRFICQAAVAVGTGALVLAATTATASASPKKDGSIDQRFQAAEAQFTDCPETVAEETLCLGIDVFAFSVDGKIAGQHTRENDVQVGVAQVHAHPDGTFDIDPVPIAFGDAPLNFHLDGFHQTKIRGSVPLSDGTVAIVDFTLKAAGNQQTFDDTGDFAISECPSGSGTVTAHVRTQDASTLGSVIVHDSTAAPTSVVMTPFMQDETDTGNCD